MEGKTLNKNFHSLLFVFFNSAVKSADELLYRFFKKNFEFSYSCLDFIQIGYFENSKFLILEVLGPVKDERVGVYEKRISRLRTSVEFEQE